MTTAAPATQPNVIPTIVRGALRHSRIELRNQLLSWMGLSWLLLPGIGLTLLYFLRGRDVMDSEISVAQLGVPGILTMYLVSGGMLGVAGQLMTEREDGTLLRAKALPHGMSSQLLGNVLVFLVISLVPMAGLLVAASFFFDGVTPPSAAGWWTMLWVAILGLFASLPLGGLLGAVMKSPVSLGIASLVIYGSLSISGVFYPMAALPGWLQVIGQSLPTYWVGLGLRSALLPPEAVALEIGQSWRTVEMVLALGLWSALGLVLAPIALRRMVRRQSGSQVAAARDRVISRGY